MRGWKKAKTKIPGLPSKSKKHVWVADLEKDKKFYCLFDGQSYLPRAKSPRLQTADINREGTTRQQMLFRSGDIKKIANLHDAELFIMPVNWAVHYLPIEKIDYDNTILKTSEPGTYVLSTFQKHHQIDWYYFS